ncbi:Cyclin family protein [Rhynchospora pubera]|uniref:Cyclin family protein n=1 Tax=Rhynchospora pubera TaxID=906938 RepID=A0AAV8D6L5_9POAL|nr:Cyclin family protein [Rhynchospora pubera]
MESGPTTPKSPPPELLMLSHALERLVARNNQLSSHCLTKPTSVHAESDEKQCGLSVFMAARTPTIALKRYLERIHRFADLDPTCFIIAFVYIDQAVHIHPDLIVVSMNVHRLTLASLLVASKVLDDMHHNNAFFSRIGGISNSELNKLELELLFLLNFRVCVSSSVFQRYYSHMEMEMLRNCVNEKILNSFTEDIVKEEHEAGKSGLNQVRLTNGSRRHSMSPARHSFDVY